MKAHYNQKFYQQLFDFIITRKRMDMHVWVGHFKEVTHRIFGGIPYDVRAKNAPCNTVACLSGHAAFIDPIVAGTSAYGAIIGNKIVQWHLYSRRVFGYNYEMLVIRANWYEFMQRTTILRAFYKLPKYKQAAMALYFYILYYFGYRLNVPADLQKIVDSS